MWHKPAPRCGGRAHEHPPNFPPAFLLLRPADAAAGVVSLRMLAARTRRAQGRRTPAMIAALFVQADGCYSGRTDIDAWPESRDARNYDGCFPVVAHPPCQLWGALAAVNFSRYGGEHNRPGNDRGCFRFALDAVNRCGGVLEHPAKSRAWEAHCLTIPRLSGWQRSGEGWVCEVWQSAYGHRARKATWLYYKGTRLPHELRWERIPGTHQVGCQCRQGIRKTEPWRNKPTLSKREANATPPDFQAELLRLARNSNMRGPLVSD